MYIVLKWNFKTLLADVPRLLLTLLNIVAAGAMFTGMGLMLDSFVAATGSPNKGLLNYVVNVALPPAILLSYAVTAYVLFSVMLAERKRQFYLMRTAGCTTRQLLWSLTFEALAMDVAGLLPGVGAGYLLARRLLRELALPLADGALSGGTAARGLAVMFLLTPLLMLLASFPLWLTKRRQRRKKPPKKDREPFKVRLLPRLFGSGGRLEYALGKNERRHRAAVTLSVVVNLAVLFAMAAGLAVLDNSAAYTEEEGKETGVSLRYTISSLSDERKTFTESVLRRLEQEGHCQPFTYCADATQNRYWTVVNEEDVFLNGTKYDDPTVEVPNRTLFRLRGDRYAFPVYLSVYDDAAYAALAEGLKIPDTGNGGIFVNQCHGVPYRENDETAYYNATLLRDLPEQPLALRTADEDFTELVNEAVENDARTLPDGAEALLSPEAAAEIPIDGLASGKDVIEITGRYGYPSLILPERTAARWQKQLPTQFEIACSVYTAEPSVVREALTKELRAKGWSVIVCQFSDGKGLIDQENEMYQNGAILLFDVSYIQQQYEAVQRLADRFFRYFAVAVFLSIALNIVNIVHMNRLSRRREYAILTSIGLSGRQRLGMQLYESFTFTLRAVLTAFPVLVAFAAAFLPSANDAYNWESLHLQTPFTYDGGDLTKAPLWKQLWYTGLNIVERLKPYRTLALFAVLFLFAGYVVTEYLVNRRMEKEELIPILKDEMYE